MIRKVDRLLSETLAVIGYAQQTLRLHPEQTPKMQKYLAAERIRLQDTKIEFEDNLDILKREVVY